MIVKCINADFKGSTSTMVQNILKVGDPLPEKDKTYEVIGYGNLHGVSCYELEGFDHSAYGGKLLFREDRFVIHDDSFVPNALTEDNPIIGKQLCRKVNMYMSSVWTFPLKHTVKHKRLPRKLKKRLKRTETFYTHKGTESIKFYQ